MHFYAVQRIVSQCHSGEIMHRRSRRMALPPLTVIRIARPVERATQCIALSEGIGSMRRFMREDIAIAALGG
jgi:hypothetical protein